ncbi:recombinase family protein [Enterovirga aerilata]|uniref:Recombinase family protein n=1 Tax=Enterovirga aerilata TaxID=2730920 RepID=A0A849ILX6_9HYPH|nr:recombinase family protein [Enterovirga sp. DB1703]NNM74953.1 recombinase family protein [Enterovirga sp. DB1703]
MRVYGYLLAYFPADGRGSDLVERQRGEVFRYADRSGLRLAEVLVEAPRRGTLPLASRDQGRRLLRSLSPGDAVITPGLDSMFPSARDALATVAALKADSVGLHMIELGCDVCREPNSRLVLGLLTALARAERSLEAEENRALKRHLASQGPHRGGPVPFGFDVVKGGLVPKPDEHEVLRRMIGLRNQGLGYGRIAQEVGLPESRVRAIFDRSDRLLGANPLRAQRLRDRRASPRSPSLSCSVNQAG